MTAFDERAFDLLLSTNIIESGLDIPSANTMVVHRADMFGLAQLYQLRGRIGRSKVRGYAYLTLPEKKKLAPTAQRRLEVMQTLDTLGAGFQLASHDLDIRGAGNLLGDEQSGHIREVGIELYQHMLEEAVAAARTDSSEEAAREEWSPQITIGTPVLIPENYVPDLGVRLGLYRRIARLADRREIDGFAAELIDRFGPLPGEVENLLRDHRDQALLPRSRHRKTRSRTKRRGHLTARQPFRQPSRPCRPDPAQRRHPEAPPRPEDPLSAQLGRRQSPPHRRRQTGASPRQNRPHHPARSRNGAVESSPIAGQAQNRATGVSMPRVGDG